MVQVNKAAVSGQGEISQEAREFLAALRQQEGGAARCPIRVRSEEEEPTIVVYRPDHDWVVEHRAPEPVPAPVVMPSRGEAIVVYRPDHDVVAAGWERAVPWREGGYAQQPVRVISSGRREVPPACVLSIGKLGQESLGLFAKLEGRGQKVVRVQPPGLAGRVNGDTNGECGAVAGGLLEQVQAAGGRGIILVLGNRENYEGPGLLKWAIELGLGRLVHAGLSVTLIQLPSWGEAPLAWPCDAEQPAGGTIKAIHRLEGTYTLNHAGAWKTWRFQERVWPERELAWTRARFGVMKLYARADGAVLSTRRRVSKRIVRSEEDLQRLATWMEAEEVAKVGQALRRRKGCSPIGGWEVGCRSEKNQFEVEWHVPGEAEELYFEHADGSRSTLEEAILSLEKGEERLKLMYREWGIVRREGSKRVRYAEVGCRGLPLWAIKPEYLRHIQGVCYAPYSQMVRQWAGYAEGMAEERRLGQRRKQPWRTPEEEIVLGQRGCPDSWKPYERTPSGHWAGDRYINTGCNEGHRIRDGVREFRLLLRAEDPRGDRIDPGRAKYLAALTERLYPTSSGEVQRRERERLESRPAFSLDGVVEFDDPLPRNWETAAPWALAEGAQAEQDACEEDEEEAELDAREGEGEDELDDDVWHADCAVAWQDEYEDLQREAVGETRPRRHREYNPEVIAEKLRARYRGKLKPWMLVRARELAEANCWFDALECLDGFGRLAAEAALPNPPEIRVVPTVHGSRLEEWGEAMGRHLEEIAERHQAVVDRINGEVGEEATDEEREAARKAARLLKQTVAVLRKPRVVYQGPMKVEGAVPGETGKAPGQRAAFRKYGKKSKEALLDVLRSWRDRAEAIREEWEGEEADWGSAQEAAFSRDRQIGRDLPDEYVGAKAADWVSRWVDEEARRLMSRDAYLLPKEARAMARERLLIRK